jgi:hypothetical protein
MIARDVQRIASHWGFQHFPIVLLDTI